MVKVVGVKLALELATANVVVPTVASVRPTVRVADWAVPLLVNALALSAVVAQLRAGVVVGIRTSSVFLQAVTAKSVRMASQDQRFLWIIIIRTESLIYLFHTIILLAK